jgi:hypothetical protein
MRALLRLQLVRIAPVLLLAGTLPLDAVYGQFTGITKAPLGSDGSQYGAAWGDYDGDGDPDLYITADGPNLLLRNDGGSASFTDVTAPPLDDAGNGGSAAWGDFDNDADLDLYLVNFLTPNKLFRNDGGYFSDVTAGPLADNGPGQSAAWADYDLDGDLDLYLVNYGVPNKLFRNDGALGFVNATTGALGMAGWGLAATWGDYDNDGDPDLYITNDGPNRLLRNDGNGVFTRISGLAIEDGGPGQGAAWGDSDNDGDLDLYVANYGTANKLIRNDGGDRFTQITAGALGDTGNGMGVSWGDCDNDGDLDLYLANYGSPNRLLRNDGLNVFVAMTSGPLGDPGNGTGVAWCDFDADGDLDLYLVNDGQQNILMRNDLQNGNHWLQIDLAGRTSNRSAIGARVRLVTGAKSRIQEVSGGSGYMSQNSLTLEFGLGAAATADSLLVSWPSGFEQTYLAVPADQRLLLVEEQVVDIGPSPPRGPAVNLTALSPIGASRAASLRFALPTEGHVHFSIYDVRGRLVVKLVDGPQLAGWHPIVWSRADARGVRVAPGVYFAKLEALGETRTQKLVLLP